ncbi:GntR family transcriptional regulator [bacterium]|nr:GntR family transcriptional regulator [bacterium]
MKKFRDDQPIYLQIKDEIEEAIIAKRILEGEQILSIRALSTEYRVNPITISNAYAELEASNILYKKRGLGFFVKEGARQMLLREKRYDFIQKDLKNIVDKARIVDIDITLIIEELQKLFKEGE